MDEEEFPFLVVENERAGIPEHSEEVLNLHIHQSIRPHSSVVGGLEEESQGGHVQQGAIATVHQFWVPPPPSPDILSSSDEKLAYNFVDEQQHSAHVE